MIRRPIHLAAVALVLAAVSEPAVAQAPAAFDRTKAPRLSPPVRLVVPNTSAAALPNGISIRAVAQRKLPLVQVTAVIDGGARLDGSEPGMATFMMAMLDEGAGTQDAAALQSEVAFLGASLNLRADYDMMTVSLKVPTRSLGPALDLMADVMLRPTFSAAEVRRQRDLRAATLLQARDLPNAVAALAFNQVVFPPGHPYHAALGGDSASTSRLDSAGVRGFYVRTVRPERTTFFVVGDVSIGQARQAIEARFGQWRGGADPAMVPLFSVEPRRPATTQVYLVDKPQAAQSVITIGWPGVERTSPDHPALVVMNTILGASFTSRLNMNLREKKGFSYGARSGFTWRRAPGPFTATAAVRTDVTDSSLVEFFRELRSIRDERVPADELERAKAYVELGLPGQFEGTTQVAGQMVDLANFGLTLTALPLFAASVRAVTAADVQRAARRYLTPDRATVVVVGDLTKIRGGIDALALGPVTLLDVASVAR